MATNTHITIYQLKGLKLSDALEKTGNRVFLSFDAKKGVSLLEFCYFCAILFVRLAFDNADMMIGKKCV